MTAAMGLISLLAVLSSAKAAAPTKANSHHLAVLQRDVESQPQEGRHFLQKHELHPITSVHCLKEKQLNPDKPCYDPKQGSSNFHGALNMGHFPSWKDSICHSNMEFFCDPASLLVAQEQTDAQLHLQTFKERTMVNCGAFSANQDPHSDYWYNHDNPVHQDRLGLEDFRPFNLAVVVADEWPSSEMDPKSMEYFGRVIMSQWGLQPLYNGVDNGNGVNQMYTHHEYYRNCPNTAVLFVLPKYHQAFISSPSGEFIGPAKGGPEVVAATLAGLDRGGLKEAIMSGIDAVGRVLDVSLPRSVVKAPVQTRFQGSKTDELMRSDSTWVWIFRFGFFFVLAFAVICVTAFVYYVLLPQKASSYRSAMSSTRRDIQEQLTEG